MRRILTPISVFCVVTAFIFFPQLKAGSKQANASAYEMSTSAADSVEVTKSEAVSAVAVIYDSLQLEEYGLPNEAFEYAYKGHQYLLNKGVISNPGILTICDFSQSSRKKRLFVIDLKNFKVVQNTYVAHGKNSGLEFANSFSNKLESHQSSLGFYVTRETYQGGHGLSLRLDGVEKGINDRAYDRAIVVHGSDYIGDQRLQTSSFMGRSFGCPAVPANQVNKLIKTIKNGTCIFIYHPSKKYLDSSKILNA